MRSFVFNSRQIHRIQSILGIIGWAAFSCSMAVTPLKVKVSTPASTAIQKSRSTVDPDAMLIGIYKLLAQNQLSEAQVLADKLVLAFPNFQLGHLIRGDILLMHSFPVATFGAVKNAPEDKLRDLRNEARVRLKSFSERPDANLIPKAVLQLRNDQKHVFVVDTKRSRLYVYENQAGRPRFMSDYYITQGKLGIEKYKEGDQKTPIGVYYITSHVPGSKLTDFYGSGALPINYPNEWDKINGRGGSGIWLHGTPSKIYSRPPLDSDGCVVLTNPDLEKLYHSVEIGKTPVIISEQVEFVPQSVWDTERNMATQLINNWRLDVESKNSSRWLNNYSSNFKNAQGESLSVWFNKQQSLFAGAKEITIKLSDITLFNYPGKQNLLVSTFTQESRFGKHYNVTRKRQYWTKEANQWKIIFENVI